MKPKEEFWNSNFPKNTVEDSKFIPLLFKNFGINDIPLKSLEYKLIENLLSSDKGIVERESFFSIVDSFESFTSKRFLPSMIKLISNPFFFGRISTKDSENLISSQKKNCALIRFSSSVGDLTVSVFINKEISHFRIFHQSGSSIYKPYK